jgi:hypothetical protein
MMPIIYILYRLTKFEAWDPYLLHSGFVDTKTRIPHSEVSEESNLRSIQMARNHTNNLKPLKGKQGTSSHFNSQLSLELHHPRLPINMPSSSSSFSSSSKLSFPQSLTSNNTHDILLLLLCLSSSPNNNNNTHDI